MVYKGGYTSLKIALELAARGDTVVTGYVLDSWTLRRAPGGQGVATISCIPAVASGQTYSPALLKDTWHVHTVRNDVSIYAYCSGSVSSGASGANRGDIEMWRAEKDPGLYNDYKFIDSNGVQHTLSADGQAIAQKIKAGIESVMRGYPQLTRKRTYNSFPPGCMEGLFRVGVPPATGTRIASFISDYEWVKVQDDADENGDRSWTRTESWYGILKSTNPSSHPWDPDLYGANAWTMPKTASSS
ncbi:MAG: hypothetical protein IKO64_03285 [Kiritimatiellae bacterium]|nr:hypothetical protein [Kiritimatiellia bacterium]